MKLAQFWNWSHVFGTVDAPEPISIAFRTRVYQSR